MRQSYALAFERMRLRGKGIRVEVSTVMPTSVLPLKWLCYGPTRIEFKRKVIKWIGTRRLGLLVFALDTVDVDAEHGIAAFQALENLIANPSPYPSIRTNEYDSH